MKHRPSKRERMHASELGHAHSPPTNSKAIRKANIQAVLAQSKGIVWRSDTPSVIAKAAAKSPHVRAYVNLKGQGQGTDKPKVTPSHKKRFKLEHKYKGVVGPVTPTHYTVDKVTGKPGSTKTKVHTKHKHAPEQYVSEYERTKRSDGRRHAPMNDAVFNEVCHSLGIDPKTGRYTRAKDTKD